jgi:hypothetical protein
VSTLRTLSGPFTRLLVVVSLLAAIAGESWLSRAAWTYLPHAVGVAALAGFLGGRFARSSTVATILFLTYLAPTVAVLTLGRFTVPYLLVWSAALTSCIASGNDGWQWAYPRPWRFPLVLWALTVAVAWPITALRETDFESLELLQRYNIPNTGIGGSPGMVISFAMDAAIVHLLGLVWFDWLLRQPGDVDQPRLQRTIIVPLALSITAGSLLALYQGLFDLHFLSAGVWALLHRASGPLMDANAYGAAAAMWTAGLLALVEGSPQRRTVAIAAALVCWGGLWMSGSRTAFASGCVALAVAGSAAVKHRPLVRMRPRILVIGAGAAALVIATLLVVPVSSESPLRRLTRTLPSDASRESIADFAREMWNRNGYGTAATTLIVRHPATGVGLGLFNLSGSAAYPRPGRRPLPPDNAQNWWRHHVAELGFVGATGLLVWTAIFAVFLVRTSGDPDRPVRAAAIKGAILGFVIASLFGVPAQSLPVTITFWTFVFWYARLTAPQLTSGHANDDLPAAQWAILFAIVTLYGATLLAEARGSERPAMRAALGKWRYTYGMFDPGTAGSVGETDRVTERHAVSVIPNDGPYMILTIRAEHPDIERQPVHAMVAVNGRTVFDRAIRTSAPVLRLVNTGTASRAILETRVDRTWKRVDSPSQPGIGLSISWHFAGEAPPGAPAIPAPLTR